MKNLIASKSAAAAALAVTSLAGVGAAVAPSASAASTTYTHYEHDSARYSSLAECTHYRLAILRSIKVIHGHPTTNVPCHVVNGKWTYGSVYYIANRRANPGDSYVGNYPGTSY